MNIAIIFAGGVGKRMGNTEKPKQFMEIANKPIIIHTLEIFDNCEEIDAIVVSMLSEWIDYFNDLLKEYNIKKVKKVVPGGETGQMSIFNGINAAHDLFPDDSILIINDGVRPFITQDLITENIKSVKKYGSAISCVPTTETFVITDNNQKILSIPKRSQSLVAKAPQSFVLKEIYETHLRAQEEGIFDSIDSCTLMYHFGKDLAVVMTDYDNIKITTPKDISLGHSIYERLHKEENVL